MRVNVKKCDIERGVPESASLCPIARAVRRKGYERVVVGYDYFRVGRLGHGGKEFMLPITAFDFVCDFDYGKKVTPFSFDALNFSN